MSDTLRHATLSRIATTLSAAWRTSHAAVSSNAEVNRDPGRAHGTAATTTPCSARPPTGRGLQKHPRLAEIKAPPAAWHRAGVITRAATLTP
jgi:hypothetical protein